ncbi:unnamed protein product [Gongylonema pulchrum]|uniref:Ig-like domain-containing protein n=1 Tax=Gongylonema pulchrum TaxID=637853 RepID=A0A183ELM6_9BILA|nr:unnamed protein product [Gongylonema pulchrum]
MLVHTGFSAPTFVEKPQISSRDDGQVMVMEFRAKSILKPTFVWQKGDEIVAESDRVKIVLKEEANQTYYAALEIKVCYSCFEKLNPVKQSISKPNVLLFS